MSEHTDPVVVQRGRAAARLRPRPQADLPPDGVIVSRNVLGSRSDTRPQTSRERKIAGDLPAWEPLPPGELVVRRSGGWKG